MTGMNIEVSTKTYYTVHLTKEDIDFIKEWMNENKSRLTNNSQYNFIKAIRELLDSGKIRLSQSGKSVETDHFIDTIGWSETEKRSPEEILQSN